MHEAAGLTVSGLSVERGGRLVLRDLSFELREGAALLVTGDNGAGKSTLLRALAGLLPIVQGRMNLQYGGTQDARPPGEQAHYIGHANGLKASLTAAANLGFQQAWGGRRGLAPNEALSRVGLSHAADFPVGILSAGQKRRVALAGLLVVKRPLWLLDEPATAIDSRSEALLVDLIEAHLRAGGLVVAAVHAPLAIKARRLRLGAA